MAHPSGKSKPLRVLVLTYPTHIPPENASAGMAKHAEWKLEFNVLNALKRLGHTIHTVGVWDDLSVIGKAVEVFRPHIAFNLLDEFDGQSAFDQNVVSYLELLKIPYTGCNPRGLILARDKILSKKIITFHNISAPQHWLFLKNSKIRVPENLPFPLFVKSSSEEASLGIAQSSIVRTRKQMLSRIEFIHEKLDTHALVESYISGREFYVGVLGNDTVEAFPVWELRFLKTPPSVERIATRSVKWNPKYQKKYGITSGKAKLTPAQCRHVQATAKKVYNALNMSGYARMDFRISKSGELFFLEANPNPHICHEEDMAESARAAGMTYQKFIAKILKLGLAWNPKELQSAA